MTPRPLASMLFALAMTVLVFACANPAAQAPAPEQSAVPAPTADPSPNPTPIPIFDLSPTYVPCRLGGGPCQPEGPGGPTISINSIGCWRNGVPCRQLRGTPVTCQGVYCYAIIDGSGPQQVAPGDEICQNDDGKLKCLTVPMVGPEATPIGKVYCRQNYCYHSPATSPNGTPLPAVAPPVGTPERLFVPNLVPKLGTVRIASWTGSPEADFLNNLAGYMMVYGYSYAVELVDVTAMTYEAALAKGTVDVVISGSKTEAGDWYSRNVGAGVVDLGSAYGRESDLRVLVRAGLQRSAPDVFRFLTGFRPGPDLIAALSAQSTDIRLGPRPGVSAIAFLKGHESVWTPWVSPSVAKAFRESVESKIGLVDYACFTTGGDHKGYTELFVSGKLSGSAGCGN